MGILDPTLPAVAHLTGHGASAVLAAAVARAGGTLLDSRMSQVQYRPGREVVVRYRCDIGWPDGRRSHDTLLAAASETGQLPGAVPVTAQTDDGELDVSVWRWPFDPILTGLPTAVTAQHLAHAVRSLGVDLGSGPAEIDVVAYRPTERAVVRLRPATGPPFYVKVVPPATAPALAARHRMLSAAGLPVPGAIAVDAATGLLVLSELAGTTLRDRVKGDLPGWPNAADLMLLLERLSSAPVEGLRVIPNRLQDALGHGDLLRAVAPEHAATLAQVLDGVRAEVPAAAQRPSAVIHGDLHEAQIVVDDGTVTGLLDIDDVGIGDPVTDMASLVAHLRFRSLLSADPAAAARLAAYARRLHDAFAPQVPGRAMDVTVAAVLVGLATGPFRIQRAGWRDEIAVVLADALRLVEHRDRDEELLRSTSRPSRTRLAE